MKKISLLLAGFLLVGTMSAQKKGGFGHNNSSGELEDLIKVGVQAGIPISDAKNASNFTLGLNASYQHLVSPNVGLGIATGYSYFFGKNDTTTDNALFKSETKQKDFGVLPVAGLIRIYPAHTGLYFGADVGYGFLFNAGRGTVKTTNKILNTTTESDYDNSDNQKTGGFYLKPEVGYHNNDWNFFGYYQNTFITDNNISALGVGVSYNIPF